MKFKNSLNKLFFVVILTVLVYNLTSAQSEKHFQLPIEQVDPIVLTMPSFDSANNIPTKDNQSLTFKLLKVENNNDKQHTIWLRENKLKDKEYKVPSPSNKEGNVPQEVPLKYMSNIITKGIQSKNYNIFLYGENFAQSRFMLVTDKENKEIRYFFDLKNFTKAPEYKVGDEEYIYQSILWATIDKDSILYVANAHNTYAESSLGRNAYITAIDLRTKAILWRSQSLVSNCNFVIYENYILTGYGFTKEKDYLYYLDKSTGATQGSLLLDSAPYYIDIKSNQLYLQTYNKNYRYKIIRK